MLQLEQTEDEGTEDNVPDTSEQSDDDNTSDVSMAVGDTQSNAEVAATVASSSAVAHDRETVQKTPTSSSKEDAKLKSRKGKGKSATEEEKCMAIMGKYFTKKLGADEQEDEDDLFCKMLATEMKKVGSRAVKRGMKKKLLDVVTAAQEEEEQLQFQLQTYTMWVQPGNVSGNDTSGQPSTSDGQLDTAQSAQLLMQLANFDSSATAGQE